MQIIINEDNVKCITLIMVILMNIITLTIKKKTLSTNALFSEVVAVQPTQDLWKFFIPMQFEGKSS